MRPANPIPMWGIYLAVLAPGIWLFARRLLARASDDLWLSRVGALPVGAAAWLFACHLVGRATRSFHVAFVASTVLVGVGGYVWAFVERKRPRETYRVAPSPWAWVTAVLAALAIAPAALDHDFFDETHVTGHLAVVAELQNGTYPPRSLTFPAFELRYHYGFDVVAALVSGLSRLPIDRSVDAVTIGSFFSSWLLFWIVGERLTRGSGPFAASVGLLGGGFAQVCAEKFDKAHPLAVHLLEVCSESGQALNPHFTNYYFQHPFAAGTPIALAVFGIHLQRRGGPSVGRSAVLAFLLVALSLCQIVLFATVAGTLLVAECLEDGKPSLRRVVGALGAAAVPLAVAPLLGGFFAASDGVGFGLEASHGIASGLRGSVLWVVRTFGLLLPLAAFGLVRTPSRWLFLGLATGCLVVLNVVRYQYTWDIVKFAAVAQLALAFPAARALAALVARPRLRPLGWAAAGLVLLPGLSFLFAFDARLSGVPAGYAVRAPMLDGDHLFMANHLRRRAFGEDVVYVPSARMEAYASWAGIPQLWVDNAAGFPFSRERIARRTRLGASLPVEPGPYLDEGVRYFVVDPADAKMTKITDDWTREGRAAVIATFGVVRLVELSRAAGVTASSSATPSAAPGPPR